MFVKDELALQTEIQFYQIRGRLKKNEKYFIEMLNKYLNNDFVKRMQSKRSRAVAI